MKKSMSILLSLAMLLSAVTALFLPATAVESSSVLHEKSEEATIIRRENLAPMVTDISAELERTVSSFGEHVTQIEVPDEYLCTTTAQKHDGSEASLSDEQLSLPTDELVDLIVQNPVMYRLCFGSRPDSFDSAYLSLRKSFNALRELETREDAVSTLLAKLVDSVRSGESADAFGRYVLGALLKVSAYQNRLTFSERIAYAQVYSGNQSYS